MAQRRPRAASRLRSLVLAIAATAAAAPASAFSVVAAPVSRRREAMMAPRNRNMLRRTHGSAAAAGLRSASLSEYSEAEISDMTRLILSLSSVTADDARRRQVVALFDERFSTQPSLKPEGDRTFDRDTERFCYLFDKILIQVGEDVQRKAALQAERNDSESPAAEGVDSVAPAAPRSKSDEELQLWALIDMMVQSKTIVKRARGELGKEGAFG